MKDTINHIIMYSTSWCADCARAKMFFDTNGIKYEEIDIEENSEAVEVVERINEGYRSVPTIIVTMADNSKHILVEPTTSELHEFFL